MRKGEGLEVLDERMKALDPNQNEVYKFLRCEQGEKSDVKKMMERVKKEIKITLEQIMKTRMNDENLVKTINCRVIPVAGYIMNVCNLSKSDINELDKIVGCVLRKEGYHGKQASDKRLYGRREEGGRGLKSFREVYDETKVRVACYMATTTNEWIRVVWENEYNKEHLSLNREAEDVTCTVNVQVIFSRDDIVIAEENFTNWRIAWRKLKNMIKKGQCKNKTESLKAKKLQSEIPLKYDEEDYGWLKHSTDPRKTASIFSLQE